MQNQIINTFLRNIELKWMQTCIKIRPKSLCYKIAIQLIIGGLVNLEVLSINEKFKFLFAI